MTVDLDPSKEEVIFWKCDLNRQKSLSINVPLINHGLNSALLNLIKSEMGDKERERRRLTSTLNKDSLLSKYLPAQYIHGERKCKVSNSNPQGQCQAIFDLNLKDIRADVSFGCVDISAGVNSIRTCFFETLDLITVNKLAPGSP